MCAINCGDVDTAKSAFEAMPTLVQDDPLTRYLMFKVSLLGWDHDLGGECIDHLCKCSDKEKSQDILYACVREAQQVGDKLCTLTALKAVVEKCSSETDSRAHLPSVMRCAVRLIYLIETEEEKVSDIGSGFTEDLCHIYERGKLHVLHISK